MRDWFEEPFSRFHPRSNILHEKNHRLWQQLNIHQRGSLGSNFLGFHLWGLVSPMPMEPIGVKDFDLDRDYRVLILFLIRIIRGQQEFASFGWFGLFEVQSQTLGPFPLFFLQKIEASNCNQWLFLSLS